MRTQKILWIIAVAGLCVAVCLVLEWQAVRKLNSENDALRRQVGSLAKLTAEIQQWSNLLARASARATDAPAVELARLRSEVVELRRQTDELAAVHADTRATHDALISARKAQMASRAKSNPNPGTAAGGQFEILEAHYGTDQASADVLAELNDRVRGDRLKMIANSKLTGDVDPERTKVLTVVFRSGGMVLTNHFREGDVVILPPEAQ